LDYKFELLRTIHTGIVAVAEWYNFRIPTGGARKRGGGGAAIPWHGDSGASCAPGEATKAGCMAATGHACRPRSPAASAPPHAGSGGEKAAAAAAERRPAAANCDAARVAVGVVPFALADGGVAADAAARTCQARGARRNRVAARRAMNSKRWRLLAARRRLCERHRLGWLRLTGRAHARRPPGWQSRQWRGGRQERRWRQRRRSRCQRGHAARAVGVGAPRRKVRRDTAAPAAARLAAAQAAAGRRCSTTECGSSHTGEGSIPHVPPPNVHCYRAIGPGKSGRQR